MLGLLYAVLDRDLKRVLAYSTISQLGYMMLGIGVGGWGAGLFHLITHAFFKSLMFLASGSVIYGCHHVQEMPLMGGLRKKMPTTRLTFLIGTLAIAGVPFLSGFFSKDEILWDTLTKKQMIPVPHNGSAAWSNGETAFTVPMFDAFMRRTIPDWSPPRKKRARKKR